MNAPIPASDFAAAWRERARVAATPASPGLFLALAPMDGVTDWVHRDLVTSFGDGESGISVCVSEFVRVTQAAVSDTTLLSHCPELASGGKTASGVPVFVQLLGGESAPLAESAVRAVELGALGIDLNFGCPAKTVNRHDGGATILRCPKRVETIIGAVRTAVPSRVPVTAKVRLGWDDSKTLTDIVRAVEWGGANWVTIHARTRTQGYRPPVDWVALGRARRAVSIPVVANGDIRSSDDLQSCGRTSDCRAFMIGRGVMSRPHLFRSLRGWTDSDLDFLRFLAVLDEYVQRLQSAGATEHAALCRLKQWLRLGAVGDCRIAELFDSIKRLDQLATAVRLLQPR